MKAYVGIDAAINSTGLVIRIPETSKVHFCKIVSKLDKKNSNSVKQYKYDRLIDKSTYSTEDIGKIVSSSRLCKVIKKILDKHCKEVTEYEFSIEGSMMSQGFKKKQSRVTDLVANNSIIKLFLLSIPNGTIEVVAPSALKKSYTGDARTKKKGLDGKWIKLDPKKKMQDVFVKEFKGFHISGKLDDVIDAYGLSTHTENKVKRKIEHDLAIIRRREEKKAARLAKKNARK